MPVPVDLDEEFGRMLLERGEEFMLHHVEERIPPDPDEWDVASTGEADELLDRSGEYVTIREDEFEDAVRLARQELERKAVLDVAEERYEEARERLKSWIEEHLETDAIQVPSRVDGEEVLDKFRIIRKAGGTYVRTSQLLDSRPVDRDALVRMLQQWRSGGLLPEDFDVEETVEELALDVGRFEGEKSPSVYLREWPKGDLRERFDLE